MLHITRGTVVLYLKWTVTLQHYARNCRRLPRVLLCFCCCCDEGFALLLVPFSLLFSLPQSLLPLLPPTYFFFDLP